MSLSLVSFSAQSFPCIPSCPEIHSPTAYGSGFRKSPIGALRSRNPTMRNQSKRRYVATGLALAAVLSVPAFLSYAQQTSGARSKCSSVGNEGERAFPGEGGARAGARTREGRHQRLAYDVGGRAECRQAREVRRGDSCTRTTSPRTPPRTRALTDFVSRWQGIRRDSHRGRYARLGGEVDRHGDRHGLHRRRSPAADHPVMQALGAFEATDETFSPQEPRSGSHGPHGSHRRNPARAGHLGAQSGQRTRLLHRLRAR